VSWKLSDSHNFPQNINEREREGALREREGLHTSLSLFFFVFFFLSLVFLCFFLTFEERQPLLRLLSNSINRCQGETSNRSRSRSDRGASHLGDSGSRCFDTENIDVCISLSRCKEKRESRRGTAASPSRPLREPSLAFSLT
jgi:hypothetical protein